MENLLFKPLTSQYWDDFVELFGEKGACQGCWCMYFRLRGKDFNANAGKDNKQLMKALVESGVMPGILAFHENRAIGWCSFGPREDFIRLENSRCCKPVDDQQVWSIVCFFIHKSFRRKGVSQELLNEAINYIRKQNGKMIEAYAIDDKNGKSPSNVSAYVGPVTMYQNAGFVEIARQMAHRPIMRLDIS